jgi:hypothetical protein
MAINTDIRQSERRNRRDIHHQTRRILFQLSGQYTQATISRNATFAIQITRVLAGQLEENAPGLVMNVRRRPRLTTDIINKDSQPAGITLGTDRPIIATNYIAVSTSSYMVGTLRNSGVGVENCRPCSPLSLSTYL